MLGVLDNTSELSVESATEHGFGHGSGSSEKAFDVVGATATATADGLNLSWGLDTCAVVAIRFHSDGGLIV